MAAEPRGAARALGGTDCDPARTSYPGSIARTTAHPVLSAIRNDFAILLVASHHDGLVLRDNVRCGFGRISARQGITLHRSPATSVGGGLSCAVPSLNPLLTCPKGSDDVQSRLRRA